MRPYVLPLLAASSVVAQSTRLLWNFTSGDVDIENSALRPNGELLLTTFYNASLYKLNPHAKNPQAELVAELPGATALCGIAAIGVDKYAVVGGIRGNYHYDNETIYTVDFSKNESSPVITAAVELPAANMLNGMASLPALPHVVMVGDAASGVIFRVDTVTGDNEVVIENALLAAPTNATLPIGINGLKIADGHIYFTNSARNIFAKIPISDDGETIGEIEIVARLVTQTAGTDWDDFQFAPGLVAYVAQPENAIAKILPDGTTSIVAGGGNSTAIDGPTSIQITKDGKSLYVTTRAGQVVEVQL